jgi:hypothetical protein
MKFLNNLKAAQGGNCYVLTPSSLSVKIRFDNATDSSFLSLQASPHVSLFIFGLALNIP